MGGERSAASDAGGGHGRVYGAGVAKEPLTRRVFREALECGGVEPPLWEGGGRWQSRRRSKHHTPRLITIPPPSQSGGSIATALQSFAKCATSRASIKCSPTSG